MAAASKRVVHKTEERDRSMNWQLMTCQLSNKFNSQRPDAGTLISELFIKSTNLIAREQEWLGVIKTNLNT
jgi:hypothetical protein